MSVVIWRDSVAMGDDVDAPHEWVMPLEDHTSIGAVVEAMLHTPYLASIGGGRATWIVEGARPLAVVAQQWAAPRWLVARELPATALRRSGGAPDFQVRYWCQVDPDLVYECLRTGTPLPDRHGR